MHRLLIGLSMPHILSYYKREAVIIPEEVHYNSSGLNRELPRENKHSYWVLSVYQGLTQWFIHFHQHSYADDAQGKCLGKKRADDVKRCIVDKYKMNLSSPSVPTRRGW
jgi:hypothetical protein